MPGLGDLTPLACKHDLLKHGGDITDAEASNLWQVWINPTERGMSSLLNELCARRNNISVRFNSRCAGGIPLARLCRLTE